MESMTLHEESILFISNLLKESETVHNQRFFARDIGLQPDIVEGTPYFEGELNEKAIYHEVEAHEINKDGYYEIPNKSVLWLVVDGQQPFNEFNILIKDKNHYIEIMDVTKRRELKIELDQKYREIIEKQKQIVNEIKNISQYLDEKELQKAEELKKLIERVNDISKTLSLRDSSQELKDIDLKIEHHKTCLGCPFLTIWLEEALKK